MKVNDINIANIKTHLDKSFQFLEQIRGIINTGKVPPYSQAGLPIDLLIKSLMSLTSSVKNYNSYYAEQLQNYTANIKLPNGQLNSFSFGKINCILDIIRNELNTNQNRYQHNNNKNTDSFEIFIGHGHNLMWARIGLYLSDVMKIKPRYFEDENRCGQIIPEEIEKFVNDPNIKLGIFTLMKELDSTEGNLPRQNVVDEAARFSTKLGRERVLLIVEEGIQLPTNLSGIVYLPYKGDEEGLMLKIKDFIEKFK